MNLSTTSQGWQSTMRWALEVDLTLRDVLRRPVGCGHDHRARQPLADLEERVDEPVSF